MIKFSDSHEWVRVEGNVGVVGITHHAQGELGEIVYVELPELGRDLSSGDEAAVLESTKAAADVYAPVSGKVLEVNTALADASEMINQSPEGEGWIFKVELKDPIELERLMDPEAYGSYVHQ